MTIHLDTCRKDLLTIMCLMCECTSFFVYSPRFDPALGLLSDAILVHKEEIAGKHHAWSHSCSVATQMQRGQTRAALPLPWCWKSRVLSAVVSSLGLHTGNDSHLCFSREAALVHWVGYNYRKDTWVPFRRIIMSPAGKKGEVPKIPYSKAIRSSAVASVSFATGPGEACVFTGSS